MDILNFKIENQGKNSIMPIAFQTLIDNTKDMMFVKDVNLVYVAASMPFAKMVGKESVEEIVGKTDFEIFEDEGLAKRYVADDRKILAGKKDLVDYIEPITDENGQARYGSTSKHILKDAAGNHIGILGITRDITREYINRQQQQRELKYLFELPEDTYAVTYVDVDAWRIISQRRHNIANGTFQSCYTVESLVEAALDSIMDKNCEAIKFYRRFNPSYLHDIFESGRRRVAFKYQRVLSDGSTHWVHNIVRFIMDADNGHLCVMLSAQNIDDQKVEEEKLILSAKMDKMTMLLNRETTMEMIQKTLKEEPDKLHALFMIDVDNFKALNDTYGHQAGDTFLIRFAAEIKNSFDDNDITGRIGGDEFFALMCDAPDIETIQARAEELLDGIQKASAEYSDIQISASIGIGLYPTNGRSIGQLYAHADKALYQAKRKGKNQIVFILHSKKKDFKKELKKEQKKESKKESKKDSKNTIREQIKI